MAAQSSPRATRISIEIPVIHRYYCTLDERARDTHTLPFYIVSRHTSKPRVCTRLSVFLAPSCPNNINIRRSREYLVLFFCLRTTHIDPCSIEIS